MHMIYRAAAERFLILAWSLRCWILLSFCASRGSKLRARTLPAAQCTRTTPSGLQWNSGWKKFKWPWTQRREPAQQKWHWIKLTVRQSHASLKECAIWCHAWNCIFSELQVVLHRQMMLLQRQAQHKLIDWYELPLNSRNAWGDRKSLGTWKISYIIEASCIWAATLHWGHVCILTGMAEQCDLLDCSIWSVCLRSLADMWDAVCCYI